MASEQYNNFPFEVRDANSEISSMMDHSEDPQNGFVRVGPKGYFLPNFYLDHGPSLYNKQTLPDQVFVGGYPRSGTTWTQQVVWLIKNNLDYAECDKTTMSNKFKYLEAQAIIQPTAIQALMNAQNKIKVNSNKEEQPQSSIFLKTHLPLSLLPPKLLETSKMVYVARDPRDTFVSFYHLCKGGWVMPYKKSFMESFKDMWNCFRMDTLLFCPYFENVKEFWKERHNPNLLFLFYEDIKNDRLNTLRRVADFFNKSYSEEQLVTACHYLDFNNLKDNKSFNYSFLKEHGVMSADAEPFIRKGVVGGWREYFDEEMSREAEQWIADNLRDTDLRFPTISVE